MFHWPMAFIMMGVVVVGLYMEGLDPSPDKYALYDTHKSLGLLMLWLIGLRIIWKTYSASPLPQPTHKKWERTFSTLIHIALYVAMAGMPITGWFMSSAGGHAVAFFGIPVPALMDKDVEFGKLMNAAHKYLSYALIGAIFLHAAGALKHHFIDGDNTLRRMAAAPLRKVGPYIIIVILGLFAGAIVKFLFLS
jgi:cytochrome b561